MYGEMCWRASLLWGQGVESLLRGPGFRRQEDKLSAAVRNSRITLNRSFPRLQTQGQLEDGRLAELTYLFAVEFRKDLGG